MVDHLFFVHGTGVRDEGYNRTLSDLKAGLAKAGQDGVQVSGVSWGALLGVKVTPDLIKRMLPETAAKGLAPSDPELEGALWAALMDDPLFELRMLAFRQAAPIEFEPGVEAPGALLEAKLRSLGAAIPQPLGGVSAQQLQDAADWIVGEEGGEVMRAAASAALDAALVPATARAVVARTLTQARGEPGVGPDALFVLEDRDALVVQVSQVLSEGAKGLADWPIDWLRGWALAKATAYGRKRRDGLMGAISPGTGDILLSQRRGQDILDLLKARIEALPGKVAVLGHSLGTEHLLNLMTSGQRPRNVVKLVTVASQVAFFTACDSMATLRLGNPLPADFPPWINFFDRNDFLSFCAERSFTGGHGAIDYEIVSRVPFPDAHGAYFRQKGFYTRLAQFLAS